MVPSFEIEAILSQHGPPADHAIEIGTSREGREVLGYRFGAGPSRLSLIGGCHADEPVGPMMLDRLAADLASRPASDPLLTTFSFRMVPHANPDGEARNAVWTGQPVDLPGGGQGYDLALYQQHVVRELPGDDMEFGFPRGEGDVEARPENRAIAAFLAPDAPYVLHGSFHGMAYAAGPWFLIEGSWADRTVTMRDNLRRQVRVAGYAIHDIDRGGEKGFHRIDEGFTTRPDSRAMAAHFEALDDPETAGKFRPSSMETVRSFGGDPFTLVSEMPLFIRAKADDTPRAMPIDDQMRLQLTFLSEALAAATS
ncbi:MAG: M14 family zinc carboxypeptidase [Acidobacteriota bacterium]